jgi:acetyl esterase/lipase
MRRNVASGLCVLLTSAVAAAQTSQPTSRPFTPPPDLVNVSYGPYPSNVLDLWLAKSGKPTPLVIFIHGGGFIGGDKKVLDAKFIRGCLGCGISIASINYRLAPTDIFPAPMLDGARAVQFLRSKSAAWNLDASRVACFGNSAGAGISLWLAFHKDLADPASPDPVARQSTRLTCAGATNAQTTYDPHHFEAWFGKGCVIHPAIFALHGAATPADLDKPEVRKLIDASAPINLVGRDSPPVILFCDMPDKPITKEDSASVIGHHPLLDKKLKERMDTLGVECVYKNRNDTQTRADEELMPFFRRHLLGPAAPLPQP